MASSESTGSGTRTTATTTTRTGPQTYGGGTFNANQLVSQIMASMNATTQQLTGAQDQVNLQQTAQQEAQANQIADLKSATAESATAAAGQAAINYAGNLLKEQAQKDLSLNPDDQNNLIRQNVALVDQMRPQIGELEQARLAAKSEYDKAASVDLLSNPLGYIFAQLKLPTLAAKHNALASQKDALQAETDRANTEVQTRLGLLDNTKKIITANSADQIRDVELQRAKVDSLISDAKLEGARADNASRNASMVLQQAQLAQMKNQDIRSGVDTIVRLKDYNEMQTLRRAQMEESRLRTEELTKAKKLAADQEAAINARFKVISDGLGREMPMTFHDLKALGDPKLEQAWLNAAGNLAFGGTPDEALKFFSQANRNVLARRNSSLVVTGDQIAAGIKAETPNVVTAFQKENVGKDMPLAAQFPAAAQSYVNKMQTWAMDPKSSVDLSNPALDSVYSPYKLPVAGFFAQVTSNPQFAGLQDNVMQKALTTLNPSAPGQALGPKHERLALDSVAGMVAAGTISPVDAGKQVADYYRAGVQWNADTAQYHMFGFLPQTAYRYSMPSGAMFSGKIGADLLNEAQAARMLAQKAAAIRSGRDKGYTAEYDLYVGAPAIQ